MTSLIVVGAGHWGPNHIRTFMAMPGVTVRAAVDRDPDRCSAVARNFPGLDVREDYEEFLRDPDVDAVVVATPTSTHYAIVKQALLAGKHVLSEKPLTHTVAEAEELTALAGERGLVLMVGHVFLFNAGIEKLRELVESGEVGRVLYISAVRTNLGPVRSDVNAAFDLASHDISIFNWLLDSVPDSVSATGTAYLQPGIEDVVFVTLRYPGNIMAHIHASWLNPQKVRQMTIVGSQRMATWDDLALTSPVAIYHKGATSSPRVTEYGDFLRISMWDDEVRLPKVWVSEPLFAQDRAFIERVQSAARDNRSDGRFGLGVVRVLAAVQESLGRAGEPVQVRKEPVNV